VAFRYRNVHSLNKQRLLSAVLLLALVPVETAVRPSSLATLGALAAVLSGLIAYEALRFADARERVRHAGLSEPVPD
jgi:hypothetical protein